VAQGGSLAPEESEQASRQPCAQPYVATGNHQLRHVGPNVGAVFELHKCPTTTIAPTHGLTSSNPWQAFALGGPPMLPIPLWPACSCLWGHWLDCHPHCNHLFGRGVVGQPMVDAGRDELQLGITLGQSASPKVHPLIRSPSLPLPSLTPQFENSLHRSWDKGIKIEKIARTMKSKANFFDY